MPIYIKIFLITSFLLLIYYIVAIYFVEKKHKKIKSNSVSVKVKINKTKKIFSNNTNKFKNYIYFEFLDLNSNKYKKKIHVSDNYKEKEIIVYYSKYNPNYFYTDYDIKELDKTRKVLLYIIATMVFLMIIFSILLKIMI